MSVSSSNATEFDSLSIEELSSIFVENKEEISVRTKDNKAIKKVLDQKVVDTKKREPLAPIYVPPIKGVIEPDKTYEVKVIAAPRPPIKIPDVPRQPLPTLEECLNEYLSAHGGHFGIVKEFIAWHDKYIKEREKAIDEEYKLARDRAIQEAQLRAAQEPEPPTVYKTSIVGKKLKAPQDKKRKVPAVVFEGEAKTKKPKKSVSSASVASRDDMEDEGDEEDGEGSSIVTAARPAHLEVGLF